MTVLPGLKELVTIAAVLLAVYAYRRVRGRADRRAAPNGQAAAAFPPSPLAAGPGDDPPVLSEPVPDVHEPQV